MAECVGKQRLESLEEAMRYLDELPVKRSRMTAYRCSLCGGWHVGHKSKKGR